MAITKLMHMKEAPNYKPLHLYNSIKYILDVKHDGKKTEFGKWVGGNVGLEYEEIFQSFMDTKRVLQKEDGRQGYHFVISFPPGEADAQTCFNVLQEFCQEYLGDAYDFMFAVHTDEEHMHGHIIFNSVNRMDASKYRYEKGDWEKYIQSITDRICEKHGLPLLKMQEERVGRSYAGFAEKTKGKLNWSSIIRADVDYAIEKSSSMEEFFAIMKQMNYSIRTGYSRNHKSAYVTYTFIDETGKEHRRRSYTMSSGKDDIYKLDTVAKRIVEKKYEETYYKKISDVMEQKVDVRLGQMSVVLKGTKTYKRMYQAVSYYKLPNPFAVSQQKVRRDMLRLEKLIEDCAYLKKQPNVQISSLEKRLSTVDAKLKEQYILRKELRDIDDIVKSNIPSELIDDYRKQQKILETATKFDDRWEQAEDKIAELEKYFPAMWIENEKRLQRCEYNIRILRNEKNVLKRVVETESDGLLLINNEIKLHKPKA